MPSRLAVLEAKVRMSTDFDRIACDEAPDAVIITSLEGIVQHWSVGAQTMFGYTSVEAIGQPLHALTVPPDRIDEESRVRQAIAASGVFHHESLRQKKDRSLIYVDVTGKAVRDAQGGCTFILYGEKDVTILKVLRDAKLLDARFGNLLESTPDGILLVNAIGRIVLANSGAERLFGYGVKELCGELIERLLPPRYHGAHTVHRSHYMRLPRSREMGAELELFGLRKDGSEFPVEISLSPMETGEGTMVMSAIRDISARKGIEKALQEKNAELEKANLAKDHFLAGMSHELRTPLNAIIGFTGTLLMRLPGPLTGDQDKQLKTIQTSARHLLSLINDLLDLAKIESGKVELVPEKVLCQNLITELAETLGPLAMHKGLIFRSEVPAMEIIVHADARALRQILINLINNAIKFTEAGEVVIGLSEQEVDGQRWIDFSVIDSGVGIKPADQAKLFQAFSQIDAGSTRRFEGTGMGLYLSLKLAGLMQGALRFESQFGVGSTFTLSLRAA
ncbi:MAG: PAS domain S-box-containing protein [Burkholderiaceae bacterium]|jgi:PAS domain S-box-containing protein